MGKPLADEPIEIGADDLLGRGDFVERATQLLVQTETAKASTVFGVIGPWGSGKTSILNLITERLRDTSWRVSRLNPWSASDLNALLGEFFAAIIAALPSRAAKNARDALVAYTRAVVPVGVELVPVAGKLMRPIVETGLERRLARDGGWTNRFAKTTKELEKLDQPILVIIDDVDRLQPEELTTLFKAVRLLGRFPGVHYMLAYDEQTVIDLLGQSAISQDEPTRAYAYLEKIVQIPLAIPPVQRARLDALIDSELADILAISDVALAEQDQDRFGTAYRILMIHTLTHIRAARRYLAQIRAYLPLLGPDEVDVVDLLILIYLRQALPTLYHQVPTWKADLTGAVDDPWAIKAPGVKTDWTKRLADTRVPKRLVDPARRVLCMLFPQVAADEELSLAMLGRSSSGRQVSDPAYFDRYFAFSVPIDDVQDTLVLTALDQAVADAGGSELDQLRHILGGVDPEGHRRRLLVLQKLTALSARRSDGHDTTQLLRLSADRLGGASDVNRLAGGEWDACCTWTAQLLARLAKSGSPPQASDTLDLLINKAGLKSATTAIYQARDPGSRPDPWLADLTDLAATKCLEVIEEDLTAVSKPPERRLQVLVPFAMTFGRLDDVIELVRSGLTSGRWTLGDLAAIYVEIQFLAQATGSVARIGGFDQEAFLRLVPADTVWELREQAGSKEGSLWRYDVADPLDSSDTSWDNLVRAGLNGVRRILHVEAHWREREAEKQ